MLANYVVCQNSGLENRTISEIDWPNHCLLVAIQRGAEELIPKGKTTLLVGDLIVTLTDERDAASVNEKMEELCKEKYDIL